MSTTTQATPSASAATAAQSPQQILAEFSKTAMLVSLNVRAYGARKEDKKISHKVAADHGTSTDAGNYTKHLVPKEALAGITAAIGALRTFHYDNTVPWLDEGVRILPAMNYQTYKTELESLRDAYDTAVREFCTKWPEIVTAARSTLNGMFNEADYPADISSRFGCQVRFMPLQDADDFRVNISDSEREMLRAEIQGTLADASREGMADLYRRLGEAVKAMAERLRAYQVDATTGKTTGVFRDSLVENLRELCGLIPRLNFAGDSELESIRALVESELCGNSATQLRDSDTTRAQVAESAEAISERLREFMA